MIWQVENFGSELEPFLRIEEKLSLEGKVHAEDAGRDDRVASQISEPSGQGGGKCAGIKIQFRPAERLPSSDRSATPRHTFDRVVTATKK